MSIDSGRDVRAEPASTTANDRLKQRWTRTFWSGTGLAALLHVGILFYTPEVAVEVPLEQGSEPARLIQLMDLTEVSLQRVPIDLLIPTPALPTVDPLTIDVGLADDLLLPEFDDLAFDPEGLMPPASMSREAWLDYKAFAPYVVRPEIRNRNEMKRFLQRGYQPIYQYSGDTGVVQVTFWIDEEGQVEKAEVVKSSGSRSLDRLALRLSRVMKFRPAMMAGRPIRILVHMPITFRAA